MTRITPPRISVVTPTHNRRESVVRLLDRLRDGTFPAAQFEVVVVADGCVDDTLAVLRASAYPFALQVLEQSPGRGAATARNRGAAAASGEIMIFIDDDIEPLPTLLEAHAAAHAAAGEPLVVIGAPIPVRTPDSDLQHIAVWGWWEQQFEQMRLPGHRFTYDQVFSGILSMPAALFTGVGGFEVALNSCRDDSELGLRLIRAGARITYSRAAGGYHHEMRDRARLILRKQAEGKADVLLARKYPDLWWTLRLSRGPGRSLPLRFLHRAARTMPRLGDATAALLAATLGPLERFRLRNTWRQVHAGVMYYAYWRGAMRALADQGDGTAALAELARRGDDPASFREVKILELDLAAGLDAAERLLDRERPDGARVRLGEQWIGDIPAQLGAEPLRGVHLRRQLTAPSLGWAVLHAEGLASFARPAVAGTPAGDDAELPTEGARVCRVAGSLLARGKSATALLVHLADGRSVAEHDACAEALFEGVFADLARDGVVLAARWAQRAGSLEEFLVALERRTAVPGIARSIRVGFERRLAAVPSLPTPLRLGLTEALAIEVTAPLTDLTIGEGIERVVARITVQGASLGMLELPVIDGMVAAAVMRDAIADRFGWPLLGWLFERTAYREITLRHDAGSWSAWRGDARLAEGLPDDAAERWALLHDRIGWETFVGLLWPAGAEAAYPVTPSDVSPPWISLEASAPLGDLRVGVPRVAVALHVAGAPVVAIEVETEEGMLRASVLRDQLLIAGGYELLAVAVREALLGQPFGAETPMESLLAAAVQRSHEARDTRTVTAYPALSFAPGWERAVRTAIPAGRAAVVLGRRALPTHTAVARAALLPSALREEFLAEGIPVAEVNGSGTPLLGYSPGAFVRAETVLPAGADLVESHGATTHRLPILMYHRVAPEGVAVRDRYRMAPARFEEQLRYLHDSGYRSVTLEEWRRAAERRRPLPGRAVLFTFDDGYRDFQDQAWPLLRRYGFGATVFLVTGSVGRWNTWDESRGDEEPLLEWDAIRLLHAQGVEFGAHSVSHRPLSLLSPEEIAAEALRSRLTIERELGGRVTAFAYPYGDEDPVIHHLVGAAGFGYGLTCRPTTADGSMPMLVLPRLEVRGSDDLATFAAKLAAP